MKTIDTVKIPSPNPSRKEGAFGAVRSRLSRAHGSLSAALALITFAAAGCGSPAADFEGTWSYQDQSVVVSCPGYSPMTSVSKGNDTIVAGTDSDIVLTGSACNLKFNVQDGVATVVPGQSCSSTQSDGNGGQLTLTESPTAFNITLGKDKRSYTQQLSGTLVIAEGGQSITCSFTGSESATKVGK